MKRLIEKLQLLSACWKIIKNPKNSEAFERLADRNVDPSIYSDILTHLNASELGRKALADSPKISILTKEELSQFIEGSLGHEYFQFLERNKKSVKALSGDFSNPMNYIRYRTKMYQDIWRVLLGYDSSIEDDVALHAFVYAQTNSALSAAQIVLTIGHCLFFKRDILSAVFDHLVHGLIRGKRCSPIFGVAFQDYFALPIHEVRAMFFNEKSIVRLNKNQARDFRVS